MESWWIFHCLPFLPFLLASTFSTSKMRFCISSASIEAYYLSFYCSADEATAARANVEHWSFVFNFRAMQKTKTLDNSAFARTTFICSISYDTPKQFPHINQSAARRWLKFVSTEHLHMFLLKLFHIEYRQHSYIGGWIILGTTRSSLFSDNVERTVISCKVVIVVPRRQHLTLYELGVYWRAECSSIRWWASPFDRRHCASR